jgi:hypothetical protein
VRTFHIKLATLAVVAIGGSLALPASAAAADSFVDDNRPDDTGDCLTLATACKTIGAGITKAGSNDTVQVAPGTYDEQVTLGNGKSLRGTGPVAQTIVDQTADLNASTIRVASAAGTIQGLTIRGFGEFFRGALHIEGSVTVTGNVFDGDPAVGTQPTDVFIAFGTASPTVMGNTFTDDGDGAQIAIATRSTGSPEISDNDITGFFHGIDAIAGTPTIRNNDVSESHNSESSGAGHALQVASSTSSNVDATLVGNLVHDAAADGSGQRPNGINVQDADPVGVASATLRRNQVSGHSLGVRTINNDGPVTLDGDVVTANVFGVGVVDTTETAGLGDLTATNVTSWRNGRDFNLQDTHLTLNSTISEDAIFTSDGNGGAAGNTATCAITFSRGPTIGTNPNGCDGFQTIADPQFVDTPPAPAVGDLHLQADSPMIDVGDPADPGSALDVDGDPRALDGEIDCVSNPLRDVGADEFKPALPGTTIDAGPAGDSTINDRTPTFAFSSDGPAACTSFECKLDAGGFGPCSPPHTTATLAEGGHTFQVRATATDASEPGAPVSRTFTVDTASPQTSITGGPNGPTADPTPSFRFSSNEAGSSFECKVDGGAFAACTSPRATSPLADGPHTFQVRARDQVMNLDPTAARRSFTVDTTAPDTTITSGPKSKVKSRKKKARAEFEFTADDPDATLECALDGAPFEPCTSPVTERVKKGEHNFEVRGIDRLGNVEDEPAMHEWKVKRKKKRR